MDIGDKSWGVTVCQKYFEKQSQISGGPSSSKLQFGPENTLHVGDQFLSAGANDFRARSVGTTAWIASPEETVYVLFPINDKQPRIHCGSISFLYSYLPDVYLPPSRPDTYG